MPHPHTADRRVRRTRGILHRALAALIHEKPFDDIAVKEILARADVGRTTFYAHFRDKEELLLSATRELLHRGASGGPGPTADRAPDPPTGWPVDPADRVLGFSRTLFEHVEHIARTRVGTGAPDARRYAALHAHLRPMLAALVTDALRAAGPSSRGEPGHAGGPDAGGSRVPAELLARHVADTFVRVLEWWAEDDGGRSAAEADALFRALARPAVSAR